MNIVDQDKGSILEIIEGTADLVRKLAGPMAEEVGLMFGDRVGVYRVKNWVKTMQKTERILREAGLSPNAVPGRLFLPIIENCSVEDDDSLQELWAGLLASASQQTGSVSPSFVETLKQLTPADARVLERIYVGLSNPRKGMPLGEGMSINPFSFTERGGAPPGVSADTFERIGLIRRDFDVKLKGRHTWNRVPGSVEDALNFVESEMRYQFVLTGYAVGFIKACHGPRVKSESDSHS
jgi:hypothetical protein